MSPSEKANWLLEEMKGGCCCCPNDSKLAAITCVNEVVQALKLVGGRELVVDDRTKPMEEMKMIGGIEYWERVQFQLTLILKD